MGDLDVMSELYAHAAALERDMRYVDASDAFLVLADAAEERGEVEDASSLRRRALRNYVTAWARQRWPREGIHIENVDIARFWFLPYASPRSRIDLSVRRRDAGRWERVSVGRSGDVRLEANPHGRRGGYVTHREWTDYVERQPWQRGDDEGEG